MEKNLDEELKMAEIRKIEQMIAESFATVEKMREDSRRADKKWEEEREQRKLENERYQKQQEEEREKRKKEDERWRLEYERIQKESAARIAKYEAERETQQGYTLLPIDHCYYCHCSSFGNYLVTHLTALFPRLTGKY